MFSVLLWSHINTRGSLRVLEAVETLADRLAFPQHFTRL